MGLSLLCCAVVFYRIGAKSLWVDEVNTYTSTLTWQTMWTYLGQTAPSMGFYFNLMYFWTRAGSSEFWMRSLSAFAAIATIPVVYSLGRRLVGARVGLMAAVLTIFNVFFVSWAQSARGYSLAVLLTCLACYCFLRTPVSIIYRQMQPQDAVISFAREAPVRYYATYLNGDRPPFALTTVFDSDRPYFPYYQGSKPTPDMPVLDSLSAAHPRVWLVLGYNGDTPALADANNVIVASLERSYQISSSWQFPRVALFLLERTR